MNIILRGSVPSGGGRVKLHKIKIISALDQNYNIPFLINEFSKTSL